jgi:hypothetical protein
MELMAFDIDASVRRILDETQPLTVRALALYELQLVILFCKHPAHCGWEIRRPNPPSDGYVVWVSKGRHDRLTNYACTLFLEYMEEAADETQPKHRAYKEFRDLVSPGKEYGRCLEYFVQKGGWRLLRRTRSVDDIEGTIGDYEKKS